MRERPFANSVVVAVAHKTAPQLGCFIVVKSQVVAGNRTARKTGQHYPFRIPTEGVTNKPYRGARIGKSRLRTVLWSISPPCSDVSCPGPIDVGKTEPDTPCAPRKTIAKFRVFRTTRALVSGWALVAIARPFDNHGIAFGRFPIRGEVKHVVDGCVSPTCERSSDAFAGSRCTGCCLWKNEVGGDT